MVKLLAMKLKKNLTGGMLKTRRLTTQNRWITGKSLSNFQAIEVTDIKNNTTISYDSISEAARALNCNESSIRRNLKSNSNKPYKKIYMFTYKK